MAAVRLESWLVREASVVDADVVMIGDWNEPRNARAWEPIRKLEEQDLALFSTINDKDSISQLMYRNRDNIGTRLDMAAMSMSASTQLKGTPEVVRWKPLDDLLASDARAGQIRTYIRELSRGVSDHMPLAVRFYFQKQRAR
jgi:hypothetical protein